MNIDVPFYVDGRGRTAEASDAEHLKDLLFLLLFTNPGERVNRPDFGGGVQAMLFKENSTALAAALEFNLRSNLQRWLGDLLELRGLTVRPEDSKLHIDVVYIVRPSEQELTMRFQKEV
jgi:uncharacterized protein